jgi:hypothetical protein
MMSRVLRPAKAYGFRTNTRSFVESSWNELEYLARQRRVFIAPDDDQVIEVQEIDVVSVKDYVDRHGMAEFNSVDIETEGVQLEVFEGLDDLRPRKLAIDVSAGHNGESPADEFREHLAPLGCEILPRAHVTPAMLEPRS